MQIHWTFEGCDEQDEVRVERCWEDRQMELEAKLASLEDEPSELRIAVQLLEGEVRWELMAALHLPAQTVATQHEAIELEDAMDEMLHGLAQQLDQLEEVQDGSADRREALETVAPLLERSHQSRRAESFMSFLAPAMRSLGPYAQRELKIREIEQETSMQELSPAELLDEAMLRAWNSFQNRPQDLAMELWLIKLIDQSLDELSRPIAAESLDDDQPEPTTDTREAATDEWIEQATYPETIELSELHPGPDGASAWDDLDLETRQTHLAEALAQLPRQQRQALVLSLADGFNTAEIADFQNRPVEQVARDIAAAEQAIRFSFSKPELDDVEERIQRESLHASRRRRK